MALLFWSLPGRVAGRREVNLEGPTCTPPFPQDSLIVCTFNEDTLCAALSQMIDGVGFSFFLRAILRLKHTAAPFSRLPHPIQSQKAARKTLPQLLKVISDEQLHTGRLVSEVKVGVQRAARDDCV